MNVTPARVSATVAGVPPAPFLAPRSGSMGENPAAAATDRVADQRESHGSVGGAGRER